MVAAIIVYLGRELPIATGLEGSREFSEVLCYAVGGGYHPVNTNRNPSGRNLSLVLAVVCSLDRLPVDKATRTESVKYYKTFPEEIEKYCWKTI